MDWKNLRLVTGNLNGCVKVWYFLSVSSSPPPRNCWQIINLIWSPPSNHEFQMGYPEVHCSGLYWTILAWQINFSIPCAKSEPWILKQPTREQMSYSFLKLLVTPVRGPQSPNTDRLSRYAWDSCGYSCNSYGRKHLKFNGRTKTGV